MTQHRNTSLRGILGHWLGRLVHALETHDPGAAANAYFCMRDDGQILVEVGDNGFEPCHCGNERHVSFAFKAACLSAGGTVKGGCICD